MKPMELYENVLADKSFRGYMLGSGLDTKAVIHHKPTGLTTHILLASLDGVPWDTVRAVLVGEREPVALTHMTRVIGYYSFVHNWNASKRGELRDRHRGSYALPEAAVLIPLPGVPEPALAV